MVKPVTFGDPNVKDMYAMALAVFMPNKGLLVHNETYQECKFGHLSKATHLRIR
ncbi:hypothetical protein PAUR_a0638 [Pseudoalteromonas aurantia 208]|uniref:Uncharacterized protein n=1 Tax=Pseudoalteromonas aurantia 208 TaxID=1314867 RepID=A0ABR9E8I9_9GAMM|nr:hypothetical protein [Pseudoalteromonas aurantia 208]